MKTRLASFAAFLTIATLAQAQPPGATESSQPRDTLAGHQGVVRCLAFSPDGKLLASGSDDGDVKIWDISTGQALRTLGPGYASGSADAVESLAFSQHGKRLLYGRMNGQIRLCDVATGKELATFTADRNLVTVAFVANDARIASGSIASDVMASVWDLNSGKKIKHIVYKAEEPQLDVPMALSPDGGTLAWGGQVQTPEGNWVNRVKLLDLTTGKLRDSLAGPTRFYSLAYSPDGRFLFAGAAGATVTPVALRAWDPRTGRLVHMYQSSTVESRIDSVAVSPDSRLVAAGSGQQATVWDIQTGRQLLSVGNSGGGGTMAVEISPDDRLLASGMEMAFINLWDIPAPGATAPPGAALPQSAAPPESMIRPQNAVPRNAPPAAAARQWTAGTSDVYCVAWSPNGRTIASAGFDHTVRLWNAATGQSIGVLEQHQYPVTGLAFSPDGATLGSIDQMGQVVLWDVASQRARLSWYGLHPSPYSSEQADRGLAFLPDGKTLATTTHDGIHLWNTATGKLITSIKGPPATPISVACSPNGKLLAAGYAAQQFSPVEIRVFDLRKGEQVSTIPGARSMAFSPDSKTLAVDNPGAAQLYDPRTGTLIATLGQHRSQTLSVAYSPDGKLVASGGIGGVVRLWDVAGRRELTRFTGRRYGDISSIAFSPHGRQVAAGHDTRITIWPVPPAGGNAATLGAPRPGNAAVAENALWLAQAQPWFQSPPPAPFPHEPTNPANPNAYPSAQPPLRFSPPPQSAAQAAPTLTGFTGTITAIAFSTDSKLIAAGCDDGSLSIWDSASAQRRVKLVGRTGQIMALGFSADGKSLMSYGQDQTARIWDVATGKQTSILSLPMTSVGSSNAACSPDGRTLALGGIQMQGPMPTLTVALWDVPSGKLRLSIPAGGDMPFDIFAFSPDGRLLAAGQSAAGTIKVWDSATGKEVATFAGDPKGIQSLVFSADGKDLATMGPSGIAAVFDVASQKEIASLPRQTANPDALAISPDGKSLATEGDRKITIWNVAAGTRTSQINVISNTPRLAYSPDGRILAYTTSDRTVVLNPTGAPASVAAGEGRPASPPAAGAAAASIPPAGPVSFREVAVIKDQRQPVGSVVFSHDGKTLATCAEDNMIRLYSVPAFKQVQSMGQQWVGSLAISPDDRTLVSGTTMNAWNSTIWDLPGGRRIARLNAGGEVAFSADGKTLFTSQPGIGFWDLATRTEYRNVRHGYPLSYPMSVCKNGTTLAWLDHGTLRLTDVSTGQQRLEIPPPGGQGRYTPAVNSFACAPDGTLATATTGGNRITLWNSSTGQQTDWFEVPSTNPAGAEIQELAFSPTGRFLAVGINMSIRVIDMSTHKEIAHFGGYMLNPTCLAFSPDGKYLAAGMGDGEIHIFGMSK